MPEDDCSEVNAIIADDYSNPLFVVTDLLRLLADKHRIRTLYDGIGGDKLNILIGDLPFSQDEGADPISLIIINCLDDTYGVTETEFICANLDAVPAL
jgi:Aspartyl aminopeptidase